MFICQLIHDWTQIFELSIYLSFCTAADYANFFNVKHWITLTLWKMIDHVVKRIRFQAEETTFKLQNKIYP